MNDVRVVRHSLLCVRDFLRVTVQVCVMWMVETSEWFPLRVLRGAFNGSQCKVEDRARHGIVPVDRQQAKGVGGEFMALMLVNLVDEGCHRCLVVDFQLRAVRRVEVRADFPCSVTSTGRKVTWHFARRRQRKMFVLIPALHLG